MGPQKRQKEDRDASRSFVNSQIPDVLFLQIEREFIHEVGRAEELASEFVHIAGIYMLLLFLVINIVSFYPMPMLFISILF